MYSEYGSKPTLDECTFSDNSYNGIWTRSGTVNVIGDLWLASNDWKALSTAVRDHEPQSALDSGPSGMELIEELAVQARGVLVPGGMLFLEFGYDQGDAVSQCLESTGYRDIRIRQDLAGLDRIAIATNPPC